MEKGPYKSGKGQTSQTPSHESLKNIKIVKKRTFTRQRFPEKKQNFLYFDLPHGKTWHHLFFLLKFLSIFDCQSLLCICVGYSDRAFTDTGILFLTSLSPQQKYFRHSLSSSLQGIKLNSFPATGSVLKVFFLESQLALFFFYFFMGMVRWFINFLTHWHGEHCLLSGNSFDMTKIAALAFFHFRFPRFFQII